jgi:hypothetical protein
MGVSGLSFRAYPDTEGDVMETILMALDLFHTAQDLGCTTEELEQLRTEFVLLGWFLA